MKKNPVPNKNKPYIQSFCRNIAPGQKPIYVPNQPRSGDPLKECFSIVPKKVATHGGKQIFGWAIFEVKKIWLEAEFHVVWQQEDGTLIDLTPRDSPLERILFLPDPTRQYEGIQVMPIQKALTKNPSVLRHIKLARDFFRETNKGDLTYQNKVSRTPEIKAITGEMEQLREKIFTI